MKIGGRVTLMLAVLTMIGALNGCAADNTADKYDINADRSSDYETAEDMKRIKIRFAWWGNQERADLTNAAVDLFMEKNPDIEVETCYYSWDSYYENLSIAFEVNHVPDVFQGYIGAGDFQKFIDGDALEPLDRYVEEGMIDLSSISEKLITEGVAYGALYGLPFGINTRAMLVAPDIYEKAGIAIPEDGYESWETLEADLTELKKATGKYAAVDFLKDEGDVFKYYCRQRGERIFASEGDSFIGFSKDTYVDFYNMGLRWAAEGLIPPYDVTKAENGLEDSTIIKGESAINIISASQYADFLNAAHKHLKMIPLPGAVSGNATIVSASHHLCMSSKSENKEAAAKLIDFLINDIDGNRLMKAERGMPASDLVRESMESTFDYHQRAVLSFVNQAVEYSSGADAPPMPGSAEIHALMKEYEERVKFQDITPEAAYDEIVKIAKKDDKGIPEHTK